MYILQTVKVREKAGILVWDEKQIVPSQTVSSGRHGARQKGLIPSGPVRE
jgi:hypothetical protein